MVRGAVGGLLSQFMARELADRRARQFIDEFERGRDLVLAELAGEKRFKLIQREGVGAGAQFDESFRRLAAVFVGNSDHDHFLHAGVLVDRLLDHLRIDVEAAGDDHVLLAVDQIEIAVRIHVADIAGQKAAVSKSFRGFLRPVPVAFGDIRSLDADFADFARAQDLFRILERNDVHFDAGQHQPDRARLVRTFLWMAGAGRASLGHAPAALQLHFGLAFEDLGDLDRQRRAARAAADQRRHIALVEIGKACDRDPHGGHTGKHRCALELDIAHHRLDIEALVQRNKVAEPERGQHDHGQRVNMEQRQHADHPLDRVALEPRRPAPHFVDRYRRRQIAVAEHRAFRQSRGAAGILQQCNVVGRYLGPPRRPRRAFDEFREADDGGMIRNWRMGISGLIQRILAPTIVFADDQPVDQALVEEFQRGW